MAGEFKHIDVGNVLTKDEWEGTGAHTADGQQADDMLYYNGSNWIRATVATIQSLLGLVKKADFDANTILKADSDDTPITLSVAAERLVGRKSIGGITTLTSADAVAQGGVDGIQLRRIRVVNNAGATYTVSSAMFSLQNQATRTSGTLNSTQPIMRILQYDSDHSGDNIYIDNDGTGKSIHIDHDDDGSADTVHIDRDGNNAAQIWAMEIDCDNAGAGVPAGIDMSSFSAGEEVFAFPTDATDPTGGGGAATGRIAIDVGGATVYIPYY